MGAWPSEGRRLGMKNVAPVLEYEYEYVRVLEVAKSACYVMARGLIGDLMKVRQRRMMMQHQLQTADPHGGGGDP